MDDFSSVSPLRFCHKLGGVCGGAGGGAGAACALSSERPPPGTGKEPTPRPSDPRRGELGFWFASSSTPAPKEAEWRAPRFKGGVLGSESLRSARSAPLSAAMRCEPCAPTAPHAASPSAGPEESSAWGSSACLEARREVEGEEEGRSIKEECGSFSGRSGDSRCGEVMEEYRQEVEGEEEGLSSRGLSSRVAVRCERSRPLQ